MFSERNSNFGQTLYLMLALLRKSRLSRDHRFWQALCLMLALAAYPPVTHGRNLLVTRYPASALHRLIVEPGQFHPVPTADESFWQSLPPQVQHDFQLQADVYLHQPWDTIPYEVFREFATIGNRVNYEHRSFAVRTQLATLVMGEIMTHDGRYMPDILNGINHLLSETWWGLPAHYPTDKPLSTDRQILDLFNAETGHLMAWTRYMLATSLEQAQPGICTRIDQEINRRILQPALHENYWWKRSDSNWNPWICSNWLACALFCEHDRQQQLSHVEQVMQCLDAFIDGYPQDGGCSEGASYWNRAAGSLFDCMLLLKKASKGEIDISDDDKFRSIMGYLQKVYIGQRHFVNFADASPMPYQTEAVLYPLACYLNDPQMRQWAAWWAEQNSFFSDYALHYHKSIDNYPAIGRDLQLLVLFRQLSSEQRAETTVFTSWFPQLQVYVARSYPNSTRSLIIAGKGGNNEEQHNHNDVGSFIVYTDGQPLFVDLGRANYDANYFNGAKRYESIATRSAYHNVPIINGCEQQSGKQYKATNVSFSSDTLQVVFTADLTDCYPPKAHVTHWKRTVTLHRGFSINVTEDYQLSQLSDSTCLTLVSVVEPKPAGDGTLTFQTPQGYRTLSYDSQQMTPIVETITLTDPYLSSYWGRHAWRIRLLIRMPSLKATLSYQLR